MVVSSVRASSYSSLGFQIGSMRAQSSSLFVLFSNACYHQRCDVNSNLGACCRWFACEGNWLQNLQWQGRAQWLLLCVSPLLFCFAVFGLTLKSFKVALFLFFLLFYMHFAHNDFVWIRKSHGTFISDSGVIFMMQFSCNYPKRSVLSNWLDV